MPVADEITIAETEMVNETVVMFTITEPDEDFIARSTLASSIAPTAAYSTDEITLDCRFVDGSNTHISIRQSQTVYDLKQKVAKFKGIPIDQISIVHAGQLFADEVTIANADMANAEAIRIAIKKTAKVVSEAI